MSRRWTTTVGSSQDSLRRRRIISTRDNHLHCPRCLHQRDGLISNNSVAARYFATLYNNSDEDDEDFEDDAHAVDAPPGDAHDDDDMNKKNKQHIIKDLVHEIHDNTNRITQIIDERRRGRNSNPSQQQQQQQGGEEVKQEGEELATSRQQQRTFNQIWKSKVKNERRKLYQYYSNMISFQDFAIQQQQQEEEDNEDEASSISISSIMSDENQNENEDENEILIRKQINAIAQTISILNLMKHKNWSFIDNTILFGKGGDGNGYVDPITANDDKEGDESVIAMGGGEEEQEDLRQRQFVTTTTDINEELLHCEVSSSYNDSKESHHHQRRREQRPPPQQQQDIHELLLNINNEKIFFSTLEANLLLCRLATTLATSTSSTHDNDVGGNHDNVQDHTVDPLLLSLSSMNHIEILVDNIIDIYLQMKSFSDMGKYECAPDLITYNILLLALDRRFVARKKGVEIFHDMMINLSKSSKPKPNSSMGSNRYNKTDINYLQENFSIGMQVCYHRDDLRIARDCMDMVLDKSGGGVDKLSSSSLLLQFRPRVGEYLCLMDMLRRDHLLNDAIEYLGKAQKVSALCSTREYDLKFLL